MTISTISLYRGPFGGPVVKWGQNVNLNKVGVEIALFLSQPILGDQLEHH